MFISLDGLKSNKEPIRIRRVYKYILYTNVLIITKRGIGQSKKFIFTVLPDILSPQAL